MDHLQPKTWFRMLGLHVILTSIDKCLGVLEHVVDQFVDLIVLGFPEMPFGSGYVDFCLEHLDPFVCNSETGDCGLVCAVVWRSAGTLAAMSGMLGHCDVF